MKNNFFKKFAYISAAVICSAAFTANSALISVSAEGVVENYAATRILDDLSDVSVSQYPKNAEGVPEVIRFQEYCFSEKAFFDEFYGLFLYVYNPTEQLIRTEKINVVNMAIAYGADGKPSEYANVPLVLCDKTANNRFYKFELDVDYLATAKEYAAAHEGKRRYDLAGIQLSHMDTVDYTYEKTYTFEGFAAGCSNATPNESTLTCTVEGLKTIQLDVYHTNYRTEDFVNRTCDELNTAYFGVANEYFNDYGGLQKIKAEWYEYKTKPIFVTEDTDAYNALYNYIGQDIGEGTSALNYRVLWEEAYKRPTGTIVDIWTPDAVFTKSYNGFISETVLQNPDTNATDILLSYDWGTSEKMGCINWLFNAGNVKKLDDWKIAASDVEEYMRWYTGAFGGESLNGFSSYLFEDSIDEDRVSLLEDSTAKRGHIVQEIDADEDTADLMVQKDQSFWDKFWNGVQYEEQDLDPIVVFQDGDLDEMTVESFAEQYKVNAGDAAKVFSNCKAMISSGQKAVLFRFAVTDYYTASARFDKISDGLMSGVDGYVSQMSMFLDFDVISLTFRNEKQEDTVLGVVSDPIHIINSTTPPSDMPDDSNIFDDLLSSLNKTTKDPYRMMKALLALFAILALAFGVLWLVIKIRTGTLFNFAGTRNSVDSVTTEDDTSEPK